MSGVLLSGRSGAGKTFRVLQELRRVVALEEDDGRLVRFQVLVPTYSRAEHLKRGLLKREGGLAGLLDRGIGTFEQLAERETGVRLAELAPAPVRDALLQEALADAAADVFRDVARFPGFRRSALRFFKEVKASEPEPGPEAVARAAERLRAAAGRLPGARGRKLDALALLLPAYQARLERAGLLDHEDLLRRLLAHLRAHPPEGLRLFAMDGFTDLTEVQERIVQCLVGSADRSLVALLADPGGSGDGPFAAAADLRRRLEHGSGLVPEAAAGNHRAGGDLARLERLLAGETVAPAAADGSVRFLAGADPDDEADRVARTCLRLRAEGIGHDDILVVVRSLAGGTGARVLDALRRHGVRARRLSGAPLAAAPAVRTVVRALRLLAGTAAPGEALAALRAGDARGVPSVQADRLDLRARETGAADIDSFRALAADLGLPGCAAWLQQLVDIRLPDEEGPPRRIAAALLERVEELVRFSFDGGVGPANASRAADDAAAVRRLRQLVGETAAALHAAGRSSAAPSEIVAALEAHLPEAKYLVLDRRVDVVSVVDAEEARQWEARAVIVAGLRLGEFPSLAREDLFVADADREGVTRDAGVRLPPRLDTALRRERMLFYAAVTRATERLVLTAPVADEKGETVHPSPFLEGALEILPEDERGLEGAERAPGDVRPATGETFHRADLVHAALGALTERFGEQGAARARGESGVALLRRLGDERGLLARAGRSFAGPAALLSDGGAARTLLAQPARRSASALKDAAQCAYRHFARKGLRLRELELASDGLTALRAGNVAHKALELALLAGASTAEEALDAFERAWEEQAADVPPSLRTERSRDEVRRAVVRFVTEWSGTPLLAAFRPALDRLEWGFGGDEPFEIAGVALSGRVDRLDVDAAGHTVVVDYKWQKADRHSGLAEKLADGADLQLPIYAVAVQRLLETRVLAAGYLTLRDGRLRWLRLDGAAPTGSGDVDRAADGDVALAEAEAHVERLDALVRSGAIEVDPRNEDDCGFCPYKDLCRYEGGAA